MIDVSTSESHSILETRISTICVSHGCKKFGFQKKNLNIFFVIVMCTRNRSMDPPQLPNHWTSWVWYQSYHQSVYFGSVTVVLVRHSNLLSQSGPEIQASPSNNFFFCHTVESVWTRDPHSHLSLRQSANIFRFYWVSHRNRPIPSLNEAWISIVLTSSSSESKMYKNGPHRSAKAFDSPSSYP